jgi:hypothetical protein
VRQLHNSVHLFERGGERPVHEVGPGLHFAVVFILKTLERILVFGSVPQECNGARHAGGLSIGESAGRLLGSVVQSIELGFGFWRALVVKPLTTLLARIVVASA